MKIVILLLSVCLTFASFDADARGGGPTPVIVTVVQQQNFADEVEALGTLRANESVNLTASVTEIVTKIEFEDNQRVSQGDILIEMDAAEERAELAEEEATAREARRQVNRLTPLVKQGAASVSSLDQAKRDRAGASARVQAIQSRIDQRVIKAPFDGILGLRNISVGALVQPGTVITTIDDDRVMKLDFAVPEVFLSSLTPGVVIEATTGAYPDQIFEGRIASIDSRIDPVTRSLQARALIDNEGGLLKPGLLMQVELQKNPRQTLLIPEEALIANGPDNFVFVAESSEEGSLARRQKVTIGARQFGDVEILDGLQAGEKVVTHGTLRLRPNAPISITGIEEDNEPLKALLQTSQAPGE